MQKQGCHHIKARGCRGCRCHCKQMKSSHQRSHRRVMIELVLGFSQLFWRLWVLWGVLHAQRAAGTRRKRPGPGIFHPSRPSRRKRECSPCIFLPKLSHERRATPRPESRNAPTAQSRQRRNIPRLISLYRMLFDAKGPSGARRRCSLHAFPGCLTSGDTS